VITFGEPGMRNMNYPKINLYVQLYRYFGSTNFSKEEKKKHKINIEILVNLVEVGN